MRILLLLLLLLAPVHAKTPLKVLTLNVRLDCAQGVDRIAALISRSGADVVGLQESEVSTEQLARRLKMRWVQENSDTAILTRFPVVETTPYRQGAILNVGDGRRVALFNGHFFHMPYQPYQLLGIPYGNFSFIHSEREAIEQARKARGYDVKTLLNDIASEEYREFPTVVTGDFNEPSHYDWTERAARLGRHPLPVAWPASLAFAAAGFRDAFRVMYPDEIAFPGYTWTPWSPESNPQDHPDRLDFVLFRGALKLQSVDVLAEDSRHGSIVTEHYPSDHRGVLATFEFI